mgnify:CR=1 FL=1
MARGKKPKTLSEIKEERKRMQEQLNLLKRQEECLVQASNIQIGVIAKECFGDEIPEEEDGIRQFFQELKRVYDLNHTSVKASEVAEPEPVVPVQEPILASDSDKNGLL